MQSEERDPAYLSTERGQIYFLRKIAPEGGAPTGR